MARRRSRSSASTAIVRTVRAPSPVIRVQTSNPIARRRGRGGGRRRGGGGGGQHSFTTAVVGGALLGFIDKALGATIPTIPVLGRAGTIALGCYFFGKQHKMVRDIGVAAAAVAGYQLGTVGRVSGDIAPQVSGDGGIAAQV